jgi:hypothetical protein
LVIKGAALAAAALLGVGSAYRGLADFGEIAVAGNPQWHERILDAKHGALPYVTGHYLANGQLPPPLAVRDFQRRVDDQGQALKGSCVAEVKGAAPAARWWTISSVNPDGVAPTDSNTLTAGNAIVESDGTLIVRISSAPVPGNWIKPAQSGTYGIAVTLHDAAAGREQAIKLPAVSQGGC